MPIDILVIASLLVLPFVVGSPKLSKVVFGNSYSVGGLALTTGLIAVYGYKQYQSGQIAYLLLIVYFVPLFQAFLGTTAYRLFCGFLKREPVDVAFNFKAGLALDRAYTVLVGLSMILLPMWYYDAYRLGT